jgi:cell division protein FtsZ
MPEVNPEIEAFAKIKVIGVGGGGSNALNRMIGVGIQGVDFVAVNTDAQDLHHSQASQKVHLGKNLTRGLGAGMNPEIGRKAAEESKEDVFQAVNGAHMIFITCGMGGGTGSGASPVIAQVAKESGALTVAVVTKPFTFEGAQRKRIAEESLAALKKNVDTVITIPNDKILNIIDKNTSIQDAFAMIDDVLRQGVQGISDLITIPGLINVDFADVSTIMRDTGSALMGIGTGTGEDRAVMAAKMAINSPLLDLKIDGAKGVLFNISGGTDLGMVEINEAASIITESIDPNAKVIFGAVVNPKLKEGEVKVTVIATGFGDERKDNTKKEAKVSDSPKDKYDYEQAQSRKKIGALDLPHEDRDYRREEKYEADEEEEDEDYYEPYVPKKHDRPRKEREEVGEKGKDNDIDDNFDDDDEFAVPAFIRNKLKD